MAEVPQHRVGVLGFVEAEFLLLLRALVETCGPGIQLDLDGGLRTRVVSGTQCAAGVVWEILGPVSNIPTINPGELGNLDAILVRLSDTEQIPLLEELALTLPAAGDFLRSHVGLIALVPAPADPVAWLDRANIDTQQLLGRKLRFYQILGDQDTLGPTLDWIIKLHQERKFEQLIEWLEEHPGQGRLAVRRIDDFIDSHPHGAHTAQLRVERDAREARRRARLRRWPLGVAIIGLLLLLWCAWMTGADGQRFRHSQQFEGSETAQRWLAIDAYRTYLARTTWASSTTRSSEARSRIAIHSLALLRETTPPPAELERYLALADRLEAEHPEHAKSLTVIRRALRQRIARRGFDREFAPFRRPGAELKGLEQAWLRYLALVGADPGLRPHFDKLLARRAAARDAALWDKIQAEARRFPDPSKRREIYQRYLSQTRQHDHDDAVRAAIMQEHLRIDDKVWEALSIQLAGRKQTLERKLAIVESFLADHSNNRNRDAARKAHRALMAQFDPLDWERVSRESRSLGNQFQKRIALVLSHQQRMLDHRCVHGREVLREAKRLRTLADHHRYASLKSWFQKNPDAAPRIASAFQVYLRDFPKGAHTGSARRFIQWWSQVNKLATYRIMLIGARIAQGKVSTGEQTPEPYLELDSGGQRLSTQPLSGFAPNWNQRFTLRWKPGQQLMLRVWDKDLRYDDYLFTIQLKGLLSLAKLQGTLRHRDGHQIRASSNFPRPKLP